MSEAAANTRTGSGAGAMLQAASSSARIRPPHTDFVNVVIFIAASGLFSIVIENGIELGDSIPETGLGRPELPILAGYTGDMPVSEARETIEAEVLGWEGVSSHPHRFGGVEFRLGRREIGHLHGNSLLDVPFPSKVRDELVAAGRVQPHHVLPESGWISFYLRQPDDVPTAIELLRRSYEIAHRQKTLKP